MFWEEEEDQEKEEDYELLDLSENPIIYKNKSPKRYSMSEEIKEYAKDAKKNVVHKVMKKLEKGKINMPNMSKILKGESWLWESHSSLEEDISSEMNILSYKTQIHSATRNEYRHPGEIVYFDRLGGKKVGIIDSDGIRILSDGKIYDSVIEWMKDED